MTYTPRIHVMKSVPYIVGVCHTTWATQHDCIYAALTDAVRFARRGRGSVDVDVDGRVVWSSGH